MRHGLPRRQRLHRSVSVPSPARSARATPAPCTRAAPFPCHRSPRFLTLTGCDRMSRSGSRCHARSRGQRLVACDHRLAALLTLDSFTGHQGRLHAQQGQQAPVQEAQERALHQLPRFQVSPVTCRPAFGRCDGRACADVESTAAVGCRARRKQIVKLSKDASKAAKKAPKSTSNF